MMIRYWNPIEEADAIRHQLDRLFEGMVDADPSTVQWSPAIEVWDKGNVLVLKAFLPGVSADDLDIQVTRKSISLSGQRHVEELPDNTKRLYSDIRYGQFHRATKLPVEVQNTKVEASFEQGILTLTLPKVETEQNKVVKINLAGTPAIDAADNAATD
ncbi:Hsp20/alpha crystallin family protein [Acaryochloris sp. IP29b_bin.137]|uniref:Hsp20/alpha crystallin family protein n=1 Tax=Acaryochloris sp. IP29b_bin.137 TaxID=2969217 RepID=UPI002625AC3C|nr:Hsp20/alpha crystallin family protein [Acaryochloris sp. IP29b_bin.137]